VAAVYGVLQHYARVHGRRSLGDILKIAGPDEVRLVTTILRGAGYPVPEEEPL
jgi:hypothetical protein